MVGEEHLLGRIAPREIKLSVASMIFGAVVAASDDLAFNLYGYIIILLNDFFTVLPPRLCLCLCPCLYCYLCVSVSLLRDLYLPRL